MSETSLARRTIAGLVLLTALVGVFQLAWVFSERPGQTLDVDESSYLGTAVVASQRLTTHDPSQLVSLYFSEDHPEAPLLSALTAPLLLVGTPRVAWGLVAQVGLLCLLVVATFFVGRRLVGDPWGLLAAAVVAASPGFVDYTRSYQFAVLSAAMMTTALWCLLASDRFQRVWPALGWGVFVGLALLSRTMMVSLVPGLVLAAAVAALAPGPMRRRRVAWFGASSVVAAAVALPWWVANWTTVSEYLTRFGYGESGNAYGHLYTPVEPLYYLRIPYRMAQELYLPLTLLVLVGLALAVWAAVVVWRRLGTVGFVNRTIETGHLLAGIVLALGVVALMSSRNKGTGFVLPLLPIVVVFAVLGFSRLRVKAVRWGAVGLLVLVLVFDVAMKSGVVTVPGDQSAVLFSAAEAAVPVVDGRSRIETYVTTGGYPSDADVSDVTAAVWDDIVETTTDGDLPIVAVANGDYLLNINSVLFAQNLDLIPGVVWGVNPPADPSVDGYVGGIEESAGNPPTGYLLTMDTAPVTYPGATDTPALEAAAEQLGFTVLATYPLGDGREARLWQREVPPIG